MEARSEPEQRFEEYRKFLTNEAQRLAGYMAVYRTLQQRRDDRLEEMNIAPAFFSTVIDALFSVIVFCIGHLGTSDNGHCGNVMCLATLPILTLTPMTVRKVCHSEDPSRNHSIRAAFSRIFVRSAARLSLPVPE